MASPMSEATLSWNLYERYESERRPWAIEAAQDEDFYMGKQWTAEEEQRLKEKGMGALCINRVMPVIQQEMQAFLATRPSARYFPMEDGDVAVAAIFNTIYDYVWHISNGDRHATSATLDYFVVGACYFQVYIDRHSDLGNGDVKWRRLPVWDVYPDPNSREPDLSDARYILVSRLIEKSALKFQYPEKAAAIERADTEEGPTGDRPSWGQTPSDVTISGQQFTHEDDDKVRIIERHEMVRKMRYKIHSPWDGQIVIRDPQYVDKAAMEGAGYIIKEIWRTFERVTLTVGKGVMLYQYENDVPQFTIIPAYLHHRGTPWAKGDVHITKGLQQEINKRRSIMVHNATLSGNYRIMAEKNTIQNKEDWERNGSKPGFILEYIVGTQGQVPQPMLPQPLAPAWVQLEQEAKSDLEYTVSVFAHQMGSNVDAPETYRGMLALEEKGLKKIQNKARPLNLAFRDLGRVVMRMAQRVYKGPKVIRIVGDGSKEAVEIAINQVSVDENGEQINRVNDISIGQYDLIVLDGTAMPSNRMALLNMYMEMYQLGIVDKQEVIKKTDILDREELLQRVGEVAQMQSQMSQMQEAIKSTEGLNQTLRRQLQQAMVQLESMRGAQSIKDEVTQTKLHQGAIRREMDNAVKVLKEKESLRVAEADMMMEAFFERQRIELEKEKLAMKKANTKESK